MANEIRPIKIQIYPKCIAVGCDKSKENHPHISFFPVPQDREKRKRWLQSVGRNDLIEDKNTAYEICSNHFEPNMLKTIKLLKPVAEPTMNVPLFDDSNRTDITLVNTQTLKNETATESTSFHSDLLQMSEIPKYEVKLEPNDELDMNITGSQYVDTALQPAVSARYSEEELNQLKMKCYEYKIKSLEKEIQAWKTKGKKEIQTVNEIFTKNIFNLLYWKNQVKEKYRNKRFSTEFKFFALKLYVSSRHIYKNLSDTLNLPHVNYLKQTKIDVPSMPDDRILDCLANKLKSLPDKAKYCTLIIDNIDLKRQLYYDITADKIIGLHNLNGHVTNIVALTVYYIMLRGIAFDWKQPISYIFLANNTSFAELDNWINNIIEKLSKLGIKILAMTSSQEQHFIRYASYKLVSIEKPFFEVNGERVYYIFDAPQLITSLRNDLIDNEFYYENQKISWSYMEALYAYKKQNLINVLPKITDAHIAPNTSERREIKYAAQIFSQSVFSTFDILMSVKYVPKEVKPTSQFIKTINDLFDILNSNKLRDNNENKSAFTLSNNQLEMLESAQKMFSSLQVRSNARKVDITNEIHTLKGILITIHSLISLLNCLKALGIHNMLTRRLNAEPITIFKTMLKIDDNRSKVSPIKFKKVFDKQFVLELLKSKRSDILHKDDVCDLLMKDNLLSCDKNSKTEDYTSISNNSPVPLYGDCEYRFQLPKQQALTYVSGFLMYKCSKKHKCFDFNKIQIQCPFFKIDEEINRVYPFSGWMRVPPAEFCKSVKELDDIFVKNFPIVVISQPAKSMLRLLQNVFIPPCECFPTQYLLALFIRCRIYSVLIHNKTISRRQSQIVEVLSLSDCVVNKLMDV